MEKQKTIAIDIGHWYKDRWGAGRIEPERVANIHESELNIIVGHEIYRHLKRHGFLVELNGTEEDLKTMAERIEARDFTKKEFENQAWRVGMPMGDDEPGIPKGFYSKLKCKIDNDEIDLVAGIAVHFNGEGSPGFEVFTQTGNKITESAKLSQAIVNEMEAIGRPIRRDGTVAGFPDVKSSVGWDWEDYINQVPAPFAFCEFGFMANDSDWLGDNEGNPGFDTPEKQRDLGTAAARGIITYLYEQGIIEKGWQEEHPISVFHTFPTQEQYEKIPNDSLTEDV